MLENEGTKLNENGLEKEITADLPLVPEVR